MIAKEEDNIIVKYYFNLQDWSGVEFKNNIATFTFGQLDKFINKLKKEVRAKTIDDYETRIKGFVGNCRFKISNKSLQEFYNKTKKIKKELLEANK